MKKFIFTLTLLFSLTAFTQNWHTNFDTAKKMATTKNQPIILVFEGSDWCSTCKMLENNVLTSSEFDSFAKDNAVLLKADFPKRRKNKLSKEQQNHNDALAEKYNNHGIFPLVVVLDKKGRILGQTSYSDETPKAYITRLKGFMKTK